MCRRCNTLEARRGLNVLRIETMDVIFSVRFKYRGRFRDVLLRNRIINRVLVYRIIICIVWLYFLFVFLETRDGNTIYHLLYIMPYRTVRCIITLSAHHDITTCYASEYNNMMYRGKCLIVRIKSLI